MVVTFLQWEYGSCLGFGFDNAFGQVTMQSDADKDSVLLYFPHNPVISMNNILLKQSLMTRYLLYPILVLKFFLGGVMFDFFNFFFPQESKTMTDCLCLLLNHRITAQDFFYSWWCIG